MERIVLIRSKDASLLNIYLNHSDIYPHIAEDDAPQYIDATEVLKGENVYFLVVNGGSLLFLPENDNVYKLDTYFLPRNRGAKAKPAIKAGINYIFKHCKAEKIVVEIPACNKASGYMAVHMGFKKKEIKKNCWTKNGVKHDVVVYEIKVEI